MLPAGLVVDVWCLPRLGAGDHELVLVRPDDKLQPIATLPWFPDSYAQVDGGAWLAGYDSGICAWIDVVPGTGSPTSAWPIRVTDDGEPFAVNASRDSANCDGQPKAYGLAEAGDGRLAFLASGAVRSRGGVGRLSFPVQLYLQDADGTVRRLASGLVEPRSVQWSRDGEHVLLIATIDDRQGIWEFGPDGSLRLLFEGDLFDFAESPDGARLAVIVKDGPRIDDASRLVIATFE